MKNKKATASSQSGDLTPKQTTNKQPRTNKNSVITSVSKKTLNRNCAHVCSSSQESLTGSITSVRRKFSTPNIKQPALPTTKPRSDSGPPPIRTISNIQGSRSGLLSRKLPSKLSNQSNMRRAMSKDRIDLSSNKDREKENVKLSSRSQSKNNCVTIIQLEKDKSVMEQQISELVRNAESKKAEIATLKMEINKLKDLQSDDAVEQLRLELESTQMENQTLKERLLQLGAPLESTALSDSQKEQLLRKTASLHDSLQNLAGSQCNLSDAPKSLEGEPLEASGLAMPRHLSDWDKASSSSLSEMSVACLQDRIMQMEETHHSTNEELQATLQELTDLQDQLTDLHLDNERMSEEKAVLLESLCSQTEKLEECRSQISQLNKVFFQQYENNDKEAIPDASERERDFVDLLKKAQETNEFLLLKQEELTSALEVAEKNSSGQHTDLLLLRDRVRLLESTIESIGADKRLLELRFHDTQEKLTANQIEISQLKLQLESEQQKVLELQREREASATSELNTLLQETRKDKEKFEEKAMRLQEQLAHSQHEVSKHKDQLTQIQDENMVMKNNTHKQVSDLEYRLEQLESEKILVQKEMTVLKDALQESEVKCQHHLEDKRQLKTTITELQKDIGDATACMVEVQKEMDEIKKSHELEVESWKRFQTDLLTTVRVANDFKTEAMGDVDRLNLENKQLKQKTTSLETEIENLKKKEQQESLSTVPLRSSISFATSDVPVLSNVEKDINVAARRQLNCSKVRERGAANQLSVKSLIESIENATKQVKGQGPASSCSSSTSSLNSVASESRSTNSLFFANNTDVFIKPNIRTDTALTRESKSSSPIQRLPRSSNVDGVCFSLSSTSPTLTDSTSVNKSEVDGLKPPHPVSILANKLDPMRRNSYGDIAEKKDPLASLIKGGGSKRNALLKWCQNKGLGYKGIDITNFSSSWNDGLAFCALLHGYLPHLIPYDELDCKEKRKNFTLAFQAAESVGISTTLNTNDLISQERPDWQSIMTYVTSIYRHFET